MSNRKRILIVEDEPDLRYIYEMTLNLRGIDVMLSSGGDEGCAMLEKHKFDAVLTDFMMPKGNGKVVIDKAVEQSVPVIVVTAYASILGEMPDCVQVLDKPCDLDTVVKFIHSAVE